MEPNEGFTGRRTDLYRDWTKGNTFHNFLRLSWPMAVSNSLNMLGPTIDMVWVGKLGSASIAGVGVAGMAVQLAMGAMMGLMMGTRAMVARFVGMGDVDGANHVSRQAFVVSGAFTIAITMVGVFFAESILLVLGLESEVVVEGAAYLRILFLGSAAMSFRMMAESIMQSSGDTITPMRIYIVFRFFHVVLSPFLIFGWWLFPPMGVSGAAVTNIASQSLGLAIALWVLFTGRSRLRLSLSNFYLDFGTMWRIVKIGFPALVSSMQRMFSQVLVMYFMVPFGTVAVASHTINQRIEMLIMMPVMSAGMASGVLVGQNLGAGQPEQAERSAWLAVVFIEVILVVMCGLILLWAEGIIGIFNTEPDLVDMASSFLRIAVAGFTVMGFMMSLMQALSGAGDTVPTMIISLAAMWLVTLPLVYFLPKITDLGVYGVRWGMVAGMVLQALSYTIYFRTGRWKQKRV